MLVKKNHTPYQRRYGGKTFQIWTKSKAERDAQGQCNGEGGGTSSSTMEILRGVRSMFLISPMFSAPTALIEARAGLRGGSGVATIIQEIGPEAREQV